MNLADKVRSAGVVGAGGGGFPTYVKLQAQADTVIANGAECEPLLHKDAAVMETRARDLVAGLLHAMDAVRAPRGIVGIKAKNRPAVEAMKAACQGTPIGVHLLGDYYPAGDEYDLVHETTNRSIPPAGIPLQVGVVVCNVETLVNIAHAARGQAVVHKTLTIAGCVTQPVTLVASVGSTFRDCLKAAQGLTTPDPVLAIGGLMMGRITDDLDTPIDKTTTGVVVLDRQHPVMQRKLQPPRAQAKIGRSACDQCRYCTEYCPRYLLGYAVEPHQVMRGLGFTLMGHDSWNEWGILCCACGLCTLFACPEALFPKEACDDAKVAFKEAGLKWTGSTTVKPHPFHAERRVSINSLMNRLHITSFNVDTPILAEAIKPNRVKVGLQQGAGQKNRPLVQPGDTVNTGQMIGQVEDGKLGCPVHASIPGKVTRITDQFIEIKRDS